MITVTVAHNKELDRYGQHCGNEGLFGYRCLMGVMPWECWDASSTARLLGTEVSALTTLADCLLSEQSDGG